MEMFELKYNLNSSLSFGAAAAAAADGDLPDDDVDDVVENVDTAPEFENADDDDESLLRK